MRAAAILLLLLSSACGGAAPESVEVRYEVSTLSPTVGMVAYRVDGTSAQESKVALPWSKTVRLKPGAVVVLTAQRGREVGELTVTILQDGKPIATSTSSGPHSVVTTSATIPG